MSTRARRSTNAALGWVTLWCVVLTSVLLWPLFQHGYLLTRDAVTTPRSHLTPSALGIGDATARAVPQDAFIALLSHVVDGGLVVKIILFLALILAGVGAAALGWYFLLPGTRGQALAQGLVAATFAIWNPFVVERLLQGHWSLLVGYSALPWIALTGTMVMAPTKHTRMAAWCALVVAMASAGLTPTGAVMGVLMAVVAVGKNSRPSAGVELRLGTATPTSLHYWQRVLVVLSIGLLVMLPWLYPSLLQVAQNGAAALSDSTGVPAFAARGEGPDGYLGLFFSLLTLGGIWNSDVVPGSRSSIFVFVAVALQLLLLGLGLWRFRMSKTRWLVYLWSAAALLVILAVTFTSLPLGTQIVMWMVEHIPGMGLFRDTQKWVALIMPLYAVLMSACARAVYEFSYRYRLWRTRPNAQGAIALLCALIIAFLPDAPLATGRHLQPVTYSSTWNEIIDAVEGSNGDMAVLPAGQLRVLSREKNQPVLDPAARLMPVEVLNADYLPVSMGGADGTAAGETVVVQGENRRAQQVERALLAGAPPEVLASLGVRWVLVENVVAPSVPDTVKFRNMLRSLEPVITAPDLHLYRVPGLVSRDCAPTRWEWALAFTFHIVWMLLVVVGYAGMLWFIVAERKRAAELSQESV